MRMHIPLRRIAVRCFTAWGVLMFTASTWATDCTAADTFLRFEKSGPVVPPSGVAPGAPVSDSWILRNHASCDVKGFRLGYYSGGGSGFLSTTINIATGSAGRVDISYNAPLEQGTHTIYFDILDRSGTALPVGANLSRLWSSVTVTGAQTTQTTSPPPPPPPITEGSSTEVPQSNETVPETKSSETTPPPPPLVTGTQPSGYDTYFDEAGKAFNVPVNILKAVAWVESKWDQKFHSTEGCGCMQLKSADRKDIAQALKQRWPNDYQGTLQEVVTTLCANTEKGVRANIRGGAYRLGKLGNDPANRCPQGMRSALEAWWDPVTEYGGFLDGDKRVSNYPYFVYNCFITPDKCGYRVPQIPVTLPPHITFKKIENCCAEQIRNDDPLTAATVVPRSPLIEIGFVRVTEFFDICSDMHIVHDNNGTALPIASLSACAGRNRSERFTLGFPLPGGAPYSTGINSVFDCCQPGAQFPYPADNYIFAYTGEYGTFGAGSCSNYGLKAYKNPAEGYSFRINDHYNDVCLYYDGHPGYDFEAPRGTPVLATANGTFSCQTAPNGDESTLSQGSIDHGNGYRTIYLHCSAFQKSDGSLLKSGEHVKKGMQIGLSGAEGSRDAPHLHLEIKKDGRPVDPYGLQHPEDRNYHWTRAINSILWAGSGGHGGFPLRVEGEVETVNGIKNAYHGDISIHQYGAAGAIGITGECRITGIRMFDRLGKCIHAERTNASRMIRLSVPYVSSDVYLFVVELEGGKCRSIACCLIR